MTTRNEKIMYEYLKLIRDLSTGYNGYGTTEELKDLIDELKYYAKLGMECNDQECVYVNGLGQDENILGEILQK